MQSTKRHKITVSLSNKDYENFIYLRDELEKLDVSTSESEIMKTALRGYVRVISIFDDKEILKLLDLSGRENILDKIKVLVAFLQKINDSS